MLGRHEKGTRGAGWGWSYRIKQKQGASQTTKEGLNKSKLEDRSCGGTIQSCQSTSPAHAKGRASQGKAPRGWQALPLACRQVLTAFYTRGLWLLPVFC